MRKDQQLYDDRLSFIAPKPRLEFPTDPNVHQDVFMMLPVETSILAYRTLIAILEVLNDIHRTNAIF